MSRLSDVDCPCSRLRGFSPPAQVPFVKILEDPLKPIPVDDGQEDDDHRQPAEQEETVILVVPQERSPEREQHGPEKTTRCGDGEKFQRGEMAQPQDVAEVIFRKSGDQEQQEDEKHPLVVEQVVEPLHRFRVDESLGQGTTEVAREAEGEERSDRQSDGGEHNPRDRPVKVPPEDARRFPGDGSGDHLDHLQQDEPGEPPRSQGVDPDGQALTVHEKVEQAEMIQGETESEEGEQKYERLDEEFQLFLQRTGPRLAIRR